MRADAGPSMPADATAFRLCGTFHASKGRQRAEAANLVHVVMKVIRLPHVASDVVITLTTPIIINERSAVAQDVGAGPKVQHHSAPGLFDKMTQDFEISDWSLFG